MFMYQYSQFSSRVRRQVVFWLCCVCLSVPLHASDEDGNTWVEETINPSTEWLEELMTPASRWMERRIQGAEQAPPVIRDAPQNSQLPDGVIAPTEAARLLTLLYPGEVLSVRLLDTQPSSYSIKLLLSSGTISTFYLNAADGSLLDERPAFRATPEPSTPTSIPSTVSPPALPSSSAPELINPDGASE